MSELLKRILDAKRLQLDTFYEAEDGRIIERRDDGTEVPTPYYLDSKGVYMEEEEFIEKLKEIEHEKRQEYLAHQEQLKREAEARKKEAKVAQGVTATTTTNHHPKFKIFLGLFGIVIILGIGIAYFFWPKDSDEIETVQTSQFTSEENKPPPFGNAIITGNDVNFRAGPTTDTLVIGSFPKQGEVVQILSERNNGALWYQVQRKDSVVGWVYGTYVKAVDSLQ